MKAPKLELLDEAHDGVVDACSATFKEDADIFPITVISANDKLQGQLVIADADVMPNAEIAKRLRLAADLIEHQSN